MMNTSLQSYPKAKPLVQFNGREKRQFSIRNAILADANRKLGVKNANCFELEVSEELEKHLGGLGDDYPRRGGLLVPTGTPLRGLRGLVQQRAGLDSKTATKGKELVFTEFGSFIDLLRNRAMVMKLGATLMPGLQGNVAFPRQIGAGSVTWTVEHPGVDVVESDLTLDQVVLSPKTAQSTTAYSRQLLAQAAVGVDDLVMNDLGAINALAIDAAALSGVAPAPTGLYTASGVNSVAFGGSVTSAKIVDMESELASDNADVGTMAYLCTPEVRGKAKTNAELLGAGVVAQPIWRDGEMNGYRAEVTNQLSKTMGAGSNEHGIIFGVWSELLIGEWGMMEIITDPYAKKKQGIIEVTSFLIVDVQPRHPQSFCKGTGLIP